MNNTKSPIDITPETKVGAFLDNFPHLEKFLMEMAPAFDKLRNPFLRKTVARIATLRQAAQIGGVPLGTLINSLRAAAGMEESAISDASTDKSSAPEWYRSADIAKSLDARPMLESGEHPLGKVTEELKVLPENKIFELITPFLPAPLIDAARGKGFAAYSVNDGGTFRTYFKKE
ncbi:conserved hypothetical protein [Candidatus Zixiibacteriota bacterium]|nr:conserved hypothetical protein [candidate division Zixibacteria bacterium]